MICRAVPSEVTIALVEGDAAGRPYRSFAALAQSVDVRRVAFATNARMLDDAGGAIGLLIAGRRTRHPLNRRDGAGNFHLKPNGVFYGDAAGCHVATTEAFAGRAGRTPDFATQSGPMLVAHGRLNPKFAPDGASRYVRNGVGVDHAGRAWFAISAGPVAFGTFRRLFRDPLGCPDVLYLDGYGSSLCDPQTGHRDKASKLGPIVVALRKR